MQSFQNEVLFVERTHDAGVVYSLSVNEYWRLAGIAIYVNSRGTCTNWFDSYFAYDDSKTS